ncbi:hypothetical protein VOLCADRAFT_108532 [Volvox carteri f. nagariensis]|uniref:BED-type domain-containing protein n=1 Tax=Volvox carteri f. nagariensis TaxID=3068 RepID=D8UKR5_VOLCA|nr:uncharacterized protein VOLCADRAFT_108532 [Volvox carteri f. nagariensis]EFJ39682.1 hypothetical protein VOLCADRAFT_108532 [Volvox carteri f. nagariensis]|eukprot:XP_002959252.1 hypothetical protein VOLCADRAFT_108532 [Volvox carteri f. nagariensis]
MAEPGPQKPITYKYNHQTFDAPQYAAKLCEAKRSIKAAAYWSIFDVLLVKGVVNLVCTVCNKSYSAKNPSAVCLDHYAKHQKDVASAVGSEQSGAPTTNSTKRSRAEEGPVRTFFLAAVQIATFLKHLALFFFKCNIALQLIEHPDLVKACKAVGITLPSRKKLASTVLDEALEPNGPAN